MSFHREVVAKTKEGKYLICELKLNELQVDGSGRFFIGMLVSNCFRTSKFVSVRASHGQDNCGPADTI
jgi:hypothetical protein